MRTLAIAPVVLAIAAISTSALLIGCSTSFNPPELTGATSSAGVIRGNVHGGQQPLYQAHVFVFAVGTGGDAGPTIAPATANKATSLIASTTTGAALDSTIGGYYVLTDSSGSFSITGDYACTLNTQVYILALQGKPDGITNNTASGLIAVLGNCPSSGTLAGQVSFVNLNEASTVAAAFALAGYASDATHISSNGSTLSQTGVLNAAANASLLSNISSSALTANAVTPNGNGTVPQKLINSLANSLAACVNSTGPTSSPCSILFSNTMSNAATPVQPTDTATAAINIAHSPGSNVATIFGLPTSTGYDFSPFLGATAAPSDFSIGIDYTGSLSGPWVVAIDAAGNAWVTSGSNNSVVQFSPLGVPTIHTTGGINGPIGIAIDQNGSAWVGNADSFTKIASNGTATNYPITDPNGLFNIAIGPDNTIWATTYIDDMLYNISQGGTNLGNAPFKLNNVDSQNLAIDSNGNVSGDSSSFGETFFYFKPDAAVAYDNPPNIAGSGLAYDNNNQLWAVLIGHTQSGDSGYVCLGELSGSTPAACYSDSFLVGGGLTIDGGGNLWVDNTSNQTNNQTVSQTSTGVVEFSHGGTLLSPPAGYDGGNQQSYYVFNNPQYYPSSLAVDGSGDVWIINSNSSYTATTITELIGVATPVVTPISPIYPGKTTSGLGIRP